MTRQVLSLCTGRAAPLFYGRDGEPKESIASGIRKAAVSSIAAPVPIQITNLGLSGDEQVDLSVHGGLDKAVYCYPAQHYDFWNTVTRQARRPGLLPSEALPFGSLGENLVLTGVDETKIFVGDQLQFAQVRLRVEAPRNPCFKFNAAMGFAHAVKMMVQSGYSGFYCSVVQPGQMTAGEEFSVLPGDRVVSIAQRFFMSHRTRQNDLF